MKTRRKFIIDSSVIATGFILAPMIACEKIPLLPLTYITGSSGSVSSSVSNSISESVSSSISGSEPWNPDYDQYTGSIKL